MSENTPDIAVSVQNLEKKFGAFTAVNKINFQVRRGEIFGFLGPQRRRKINHHPYALRDHFTF